MKDVIKMAEKILLKKPEKYTPTEDEDIHPPSNKIKDIDQKKVEKKESIIDDYTRFLEL